MSRVFGKDFDSFFSPFNLDERLKDNLNVLDFFYPVATTRRGNSVVKRTEQRETSVVKDLADRWELLVPVPGLTKSDVNVSVQGRSLVVSYKNGDNQFVTGDFSKSWTLAEGVTFDDVSARCQDGLLTVTVMKPTNPPSGTFSVEIM